MIKHLHQQGVPKARIAREVGLDRKTVAKAINQPTYPSQTRRKRGSILDPYKDYIKDRIDKYDLTAARILREIQQRGYQGAYTTVKDYVRQLKGEKPKEAFVRFETQPGEQAQVDWSDFGRFSDDGQLIKLSCFSMVLGYSRMLYIEFMPSQNFIHLGTAHINAFGYFSGVTQTILYDNMSTVVISREGEVIHFNPRFIDFATHYGFVPRLCKPYRSQTKGKVERPFSYIRSSFFNGEVFANLSDLNAKARVWLDTVANTRVHATTGAVPFDRLGQEKLQPLRSGDYVLQQVETRKSTKDCFISFDGNRYSVPFKYSCRELVVKVIGRKLHILCGETHIATHQLSYQKGQMIINPQHFAGIEKPAYPSGIASLRQVFLSQFPTSHLFLDGLVKAKAGNAGYHMRQILSLLEAYPIDMVASAICRATRYGAFECGAISNICKGESQSQQELTPIELTTGSSDINVAVEQRSLLEYSAFEGQKENSDGQ